MSQFDLSGKTAIVTGGGTGLGRGIALGFARSGANVVLAGRRQAVLDGVASEIEALGMRSLAVLADVAIPEQVDNLMKRTLVAFGRIDILVNNAGGAWKGFKCPAEKLSVEDWDTIIDINLKGTFLCCQAAGKVMIQQKTGRIINVGSICGIKSPPGMAHYNVAKAGVIHLTKCLAVEWAQHNINVNCIAPGLIATEGAAVSMDTTLDKLMQQQTNVKPLDGAGQPEDIANAAIYLASDASKFVTGETIAVAGARALR